MTEQKPLINKKEFKKYKDFAFKDDMLKLAVGFMLGNNFNNVVTGISDYLVMPIFKFILSETGEEWRKWKLSPLVGLEFEIGRFLGVFIDFLLVSIVLYIVYVKIIGNIVKKHVIETKDCPFCVSKVDAKAKKCKYCTSELE